MDQGADSAKTRNGDLAPGALLDGTYRIVRQVGRGGMGAVYEATHARLAGRYAVKVLKPDAAVLPEAFHRFRREALVTSGLRHPGIVNVIDFNQMADGSPYLVMEFLEGSELAQLIEREAPMTLPRVAEIIQQIAVALGAAHKQGIVHRDLKPQNLFVLPLDGGRQLVKVVDFGISKVQAFSMKLTNDSALLGTPQYMAPEQIVGKEDLDGRADEFALAAIAYEMLTGHPAFQGETVMSLVYQIVNAKPAPIAPFNPTINREAERVLLRGLAKAPGDRFATIQEFGAALVGAVARTAGPIRPGESGVVLPSRRSGAEIPDREDGRFSTTLKGSTGQVQAGEPRPPRIKAAAGVFIGVAAIAATLAVVWRQREVGQRPVGGVPALVHSPQPPPAPPKPAGSAEGRASAQQPERATPVAERPAEPPPKHGTPLPRKRTSRHSVASERHDVRRPESDEPSTNRTREVLIDDL